MIREDVNVGAFVSEVTNHLFEGRRVFCPDLACLFGDGQFSSDNGFRDKLAYVVDLINNQGRMEGHGVKTTTYQSSSASLVVIFTLDKEHGELIHECVDIEDPDLKLKKPLPPTYFIEAKKY